MLEEYTEFLGSCKSGYQTVVSDLMQDRFQKYENVKKQFEQFFDQEDLLALFDSKADLHKLD